MDDGFVLVTRPLADPDAIALTAEMRAEVSALYNRQDAGSPLTPEMFQPPLGRFLVGYLDGLAVACGGYRQIDQGHARVQRVFVRPEARGRALSRRLMEHIETLAVADGFTSLDLHTGVRQPAAVRVYESLGYTPIPLFAPYEGDVLSLCYTKRIA
jgi:GNAT superfamily N-acetyltransferase